METQGAFSVTNTEIFKSISMFIFFWVTVFNINSNLFNICRILPVIVVFQIIYYILSAVSHCSTYVNNTVVINKQFILKPMILKRLTDKL